MADEGRITYPKKLKALTVYMMLEGDSVYIEDNAHSDGATRALNEFKNYETMHHGDNAIPYHAVQYISVTEREETIEKTDPHYCGE